MAELKEKVEQLERDLTELEAGIKALFVELKVLMARDLNPLESFSKALSRPTRDGPVSVVAPLLASRAQTLPSSAIILDCSRQGVPTLRLWPGHRVPS